MKYYLKYISSILILSLFLVSCGGGSSSSNTNTNEQNISKKDDKKTTSPIEKKSIQDIKNEPYYKYAWHFNPKVKEINYHTINQNAHINIEKIWEETQGLYKVGQNKGQAVKIAIIDDSFDTNNEDYKQNIFATCNMASFRWGEDVLAYCKNNTDVNPKFYESSHGTSVASFISASANNKGLVGSAPKSELILIKLPTTSTDLQTISAFEYAKQMGAKVINCSWGTADVFDNIANKFQELKDEGINIIFASGNGDGNSPYAINLDTFGKNDESELDSVIGVGATNEENDVTSYSNYGRNIDILAPGGEYIGVLGSFKDPNEPPTHNGLNIKANYSFLYGTSFSAPITSGVVALMLSVNPNLSPDEIRNILIKTTDKVGLENGANYIIGFDTYRAYGKINPYKAVKQASKLYNK